VANIVPQPGKVVCRVAKGRKRTAASLPPRRFAVIQIHWVAANAAPSMARWFAAREKVSDSKSGHGSPWRTSRGIPRTGTLVESAACKRPCRVTWDPSAPHYNGFFPLQQRPGTSIEEDVGTTGVGLDTKSGDGMHRPWLELRPAF